MIFMFPGQGSQSVCMGKDIYKSFRIAREVFDEVGDKLKKLPRLMFEGPIDELTMTENAQPALMTLSIAILRSIECELGKSFNLFDKVSYVTGHSVGECTALCASGSLTLSQTAEFLSIRGKSMNNALPAGQGGMTALIGGTLEDVEKVVALANQYGVCEIANDNGGGQVVVSGLYQSLEKLPELIKGTSVKRAIKLNVSGSFHSSLMNSAYDVVRNFIENVDVKKPCCPIVSNVSAEEMTDPKEIKDLITRQIINKVRWREVVSYTINKGCKAFVEIGSGNVLSRLVQRIDSTVSTISINSVKDVHIFCEEIVKFKNN